MEFTAGVRRCCGHHETLEELSGHLIRDFSHLGRYIVASELGRAVAAARWTGLSEDHLLIVELIARVQLELRSGERDDIARLYPQHHPGRCAAVPQVSAGVPAGPLEGL